jgi:hypothetical protein
VLENPGFDACPPEYTAKGVREAAMVCNARETSSAEPASTTQAALPFEERNQCVVVSV